MMRSYSVTVEAESEAEARSLFAQDWWEYSPEEEDNSHPEIESIEEVKQEGEH